MIAAAVTTRPTLHPTITTTLPRKRPLLAQLSHHLTIRSEFKRRAAPLGTKNPPAARKDCN
jgi:hypothetical protein